MTGRIVFIGRYERREVKPSIEVPEEDRKVIYRIIDSMLTKRKFKDFFKQELAS